MKGVSFPSPPEGAVRAFLVLVVASVAGWQLLPWLTVDATTLISAGHVKDDAFFYSVLVDNYNDLGFFTLDGTMPTNGFQPLWMGLLLCLRGLVDSLSSFELVRQLSWFSYLLFCVSATWMASAGGGWGALVRVGVLASFMLLNRPFQDAVVEGLEPPLALAVLTLSLLAIDPLTRRLRSGDDDSRRQLIAASLFGLLGALVFLARTDLFWLTGLFVLWTWWVTGRRPLPAIAVGLAAAFVVLPYLIWNVTEHGSLVPVSGRVKVFLMDSFLADRGQSYWDTEEWRGLISLFGTWLPKTSREATVALSYGGLLAGLGIVFGRRGRTTLPDAYRVLGVLVVLHAAYMQLMYREVRPYTNYYFAPEVFFVVLSMGAWLASLAPRLGTAVLIGALMLSSQATWGAMDMKARSYWIHRIKISEDLEAMAKGAPVGSFWPGTLAGVTDLNVTPLDGIIGSNAYFDEVVKSGGEVDYALDKGLAYIVVNGNPKRFLAKTPPKVNRWSMMDLHKLWERKERFKVVKRRGPWTILKVLPKKATPR
jgi:hypothetical protein